MKHKYVKEQDSMWALDQRSVYHDGLCSIWRCSVCGRRIEADAGQETCPTDTVACPQIVNKGKNTE